MTKFTKTALASLLTFSSAGASAAAFQLAEVSTSGLGLAYAGNAAVADNASVVATNPALMTKFKQIEISAGGILVDADVDIEGSYLGQNADAKNIIPSAVVPNLYIVAPITDRFTIGGGMNVNYGLKSKFQKEYSAGLFGGQTKLTAANYNLSAAYDLGYGFSFGAGLNAVHAKAKLERYAGYASNLINARVGMPVTNSSTIMGKLKGDEWGFGWNIGLSYDINEKNRLGIAYHSAVKIDFDGQYSNELPALLGGLGGTSIPGSLALKLPAYWEVSGYHKLTDKFAVQYSYKRSDWSKFQELHATNNAGVTLLHKDEKFSDASRLAFGVSYDVNDAFILRAGIAFDESASVEKPSISIPDTDRTWYALGATYRFTPNLSVDVAYAHLRGSKTSFTETESTRIGPVSGSFKSKSTANLYGLNVNYKF
ncbi:porin [Glaesserella sp.]|uniref:porin n=1 Tax=Glaesserella sp. TaxID=2094731 RepID=UPI00359F13AF